MTHDPDSNPPTTFSRVIADEQDAIPRVEGDSDQPRQFAGLAFSGGGIRSATFNLGIIQALAELKLLRHFDYLSTVSGGGYIGAWLSSYIHRRTEGDVRKAEEKLPCGGEEDAALKFLRSYSNYLTPRLGLFSADTLTAVATYVRNLYLNLSVLLLYLAAVLLLPRILVWSGRWLAGWEGAGATAAGRSDLLFTLGGAFIALAMVFIGLNLAWRRVKKTLEPPFFTRQSSIILLVVLPTLLAAWFMGYGLYVDSNAFANISIRGWIVWGMLAYWLPWSLGWVIGRWHNRDDPDSTPLTAQIIVRGMLYAAGAAALGGVLLSLFVRFADWVHLFGYTGSWIISAVGAGLMLKFISLTVVAHIGLMGRDFSHETREWWARLGGWVLLFALMWAAVFSIVFLAPAFFKWAPQWFLQSGGAAWVGATLTGLVLGRSPKTSFSASKTWRNRIASVTPYLFIIGLLGLMSWGLQEILLRFFCVDCAHTLYAVDVTFLDVLLLEAAFFRATPITTLLWLAAGSAIAATLLAMRVDVNIFSIYHFYRQRLTRCYLGATRNETRSPHPFTGFDPQDDLPLADFCRVENGKTVCQRPYPILNTALNLVHGKQLAWQERRAAAFAFSPLYCGYDFVLPDETAARISCYRPSAAYMEGAMLGSAIAISGAAASPNMGFHSSPALTFLMTVFNVRLGHWSGNPAHAQAWRQQSPLAGSKCLLKELLGLTDEESPYVYLSDGGHFENLGIYELVRRRCDHIVAIDAGADLRNSFDDLGNAIRKCYADFGVVIDIRVDELKRKVDGEVGGYFAVGKIHYPQGEPGNLIYIKPGLTGQEPADLLNYARTCAAFPHHPTADQWFDESQFESYRKLGHLIGKSVFEAALADTLERRKHASDSSPLLPYLLAVMREQAAKLAAKG